jgi:hypothetical protein
MTEATKEGTVAFELQRNMLRNLQEDFGDMIYKTLTDGKLNFKDFFTSVVDGFKRMVAELAAQKIMDAIFGTGGLNGFLNTLSGGFSSVISGIASGVSGAVSAATSAVTSIASSAVSAITGGAIGGGAAAAGGAAASQAAIAAGTATMGAAAAGAVGAAGSAAAAQSAIAAGTATMGSAAAGAAGGAGAGAGAIAAVKAGGAKLAAALTNPVTAAIAAAVALGHVLDSGGTPTSTAGLTMAKTAGMDANNTFQMGEFESGFAPIGFKQNATNEQAETAVKPLRELDAALTAMTKEAGFNVDLSGHTFSGLGIEGSGPGTVLGTFFEEGKQKGVGIDKQADQYAAEWISAVGARNNIAASEISRIIGDGTAEGIIQRTAEEMTGILSMQNNAGVMGPATPEGMGGNSATTVSIDGSHRDGLDMVPHDGYVAELHAGERVQTAQQARSSDAMADEMSGLRQSIEEVMVAVARSTGKLYRLNDRWDKNGLPPVRT